VRTRLRKPEISDGGNILEFNKAPAPDLRNELLRLAQSQMEAERMSTIGRMASSIFHDMRHSLSAIYANAEFLERHDICASVQADLLLEIQEAVLAMTERLLNHCCNSVVADGKTRLSMSAFPWLLRKPLQQ
jgi:signal transduction histidine kinase